MELTVNEKKEVMNAGDMAIIAPFCVHSFYTPEYVNRWLAVFSTDFIAGLLSEEEIYGEGEHCVFTPSPQLAAFVTSHLIDSNENFFNLTAGDIRSFKVLSNAVYEEYMRVVPYSAKRTHNKALTAILLYISEHYLEEMSLSTIGAALGYSPKYVSLCLSDIDDMNLFYLVNSFRAEHAKRLLLSTELKVIDIAYECGYSSEKSFHRAFLQVTGTTPGKYKKAKRTAHPPKNEGVNPQTKYLEKKQRKKERKKAVNP
jgi:AraC-like DNA-binding protein